jgi:hypothetical protein
MEPEPEPELQQAGAARQRAEVEVRAAGLRPPAGTATTWEGQPMTDAR